ncbi:MAG: glycerophosphoryl diester phosphodiesterase membrane domain-containing protein [Lachnospiraceae bacterium]|nr:glycerophosphoryl diester phosphodiesterase membrane domain-containing protein [Lachnospiraceae bacterium]
MKTWKRSFRMLSYNFSSVILFEVIYKLLSAAVLVPALYATINYSIKLAGINFLSFRTIKKYLMAPTTYVAVLIILVITSIYFLINISGIVYAMEASHRQIKINALQLLVKAIVNAIRLLKFKNLLVMVDVLLILPLVYSSIIFSSIFELKFPGYFYDLIERYKTSFIMICVAYLLLCIISMFKLLTINFYGIYRTDYKNSAKLSRETIKKHFIKIIGGMIIYNIIIAFIMIALEGIMASGFVFVLSKIISYKRMRFLFSSFVNAVILIIYMIFVILSTPLIYSYICSCFYDIEGDPYYDEYRRFKRRREEKYRKRIRKDGLYSSFIVKNKKKNKTATIVIIVTCLLINSLYIYLSMSNKISLNVAHANSAEVTAHRGDSHNAPENTMSAFRLAVENQADAIEFDVRQTKDGEYVVIHDENLKRTTGVDKKVGEVTLDYIKTLDAGSTFSEEYAGEQIPTLREALEYFKEEKIFVNVELKPANTDKADYVKGIIDLLDEYDYLDDCVVASSDYDSLKEVKEINPDIETVYIMYVAYGNIGDMEYVDAFSIQNSFITMRLVRNVHKNGKKIYAWTVDRESRIMDLILLDVDVIITNNPYKTKDIIYNANDSLLSDFFRRLLKEY